MSKQLIYAVFVTAAFLPNGWSQTSANGPISIIVSDPAGGDPTRQTLPGGTIAVRTELSQPVTGDLTGMLTERSTQVFSTADGQGLIRITTLWRLKTQTGSLEGYYSGLRNRAASGTRDSVQQCAVTAVSQAYTAYYQAGITYRHSQNYLAQIRQHYLACWPSSLAAASGQEAY